VALLFSASIGIPLGVISAVNKGSRLDYALRVVSLSGLSLPSFWLGLLILMAGVAMFGSIPIFNPNPKTWTEAFAIYAERIGSRAGTVAANFYRQARTDLRREPGNVLLEPAGVRQTAQRPQADRLQ